MVVGAKRGVGRGKGRGRNKNTGGCKFGGPGKGLGKGQGKGRGRKGQIVKVGIHQPIYLPWAGYFNKIANVDTFVVLDKAQYTRGQHFNRTKILIQGVEKWLTVPVVFQKAPSADIVISKKWAHKHFTTLRQSYARAEHAQDLADFLDSLEYSLFRGLQGLLDIDMWLINAMCNKMSIQTKICYESELDYEPAMRTQRLINICLALEADTYVSGTGGSRDYLDVEMFYEAGINVEWQTFGCVPYKQYGTTEFVPGLSILDVVANIGWDAAAQYIKENGTLSIE